MHGMLKRGHFPKHERMEDMATFLHVLHWIAPRYG